MDDVCSDTSFVRPFWFVRQKVLGANIHETEGPLWFVRQKVLGANIHETEGVLERSIAYVYGHMYMCICVR